MDSHQKHQLIEQYLTAYNSFDIDGMLAALHDEIIFQNISGGEINAQAIGKNAFRQLAEQTKTFFSLRNQTPKTFADDGEKIVVEIAYTAVLAIDLPNGMKQGETLALTGRSEFTFQDGLIHTLTDIS